MSDHGSDGPREQCRAKTRNGGTCKQPAGHGTTHVGVGRCKLHGGASPQAERGGRAELERRRAAIAVSTYGLPRDVSPHQALEEELHRTAGHVAWLSLVVQDLEKEDLWQRVGGGEYSDAEAKASIWVKLYAEERAHLTRVAKTCADVGIDERRVRVLEQAGEQLAQVVRGIVVALGHDLADPAVERVVRAQLATVDGTTTEVAA